MADRAGEGGRRRVPWYVGLPVTLAVIAAVFVAVGHFGWLPGLPDPFGERTVDRSGPVLLKSVDNLSRYEGAEGNFQVVVDLDKEAKFLPSAVLGNRTLYVGAGSVDAYVDFGHLSGKAVTVSADRTTATLRLPHAQLAQAALDPKRSYVFAQQRGIFDRIGSFFSDNPNTQQQLEVLATKKIQDAAEQSQLKQRAETNTKGMLQGMLHSLGYTTVKITFG
ncbi:DUF4230 domain-containing protein [Streptomyces sp. SL13]|jgi:hypothetical protein|uniref:DUF4230 domain-containing protein n=1 Tax=Streptantibioticus silvisoli TaxID=2705255 RepID=A0AA90H2Q5_9ACTN|nr:DUF4230 domain-containing protein [Streptantibioticus silvisoli]MDI5962502.1 DUF4230 domain-containing protein [Streptantibioticus silvisoli]MDI5969137.1 DUF4230 domain-containing protein [Streptantibioticus silvisoli]